MRNILSVLRMITITLNVIEVNMKKKNKVTYEVQGKCGDLIVSYHDWDYLWNTSDGRTIYAELLFMNDPREKDGNA